MIHFYPNVADQIEGEWDKKVVNIEYLTLCVVEVIQASLKDGYSLEEIGDIDKSQGNCAVQAILSSLEPDCINGTSHRGTWFHTTRKHLKHINSELVKAYEIDINEQNLKFQNDVRERMREDKN